MIRYFGSFLTLIILCISAFSYSPQYADSEKNIPVRWNKKVIDISISDSLLNNPSNIKSNQNILEIIEKSLMQWQNAADIEFRLTISGKQSVSPSGKAGDGVSLITIAQTPENILLFGENANDVSAITKVFYDKKGNITEADIVLNPILFFSTDGTIGTFDLQATLTHEIGHLVGLEHSGIIGSTMHNQQGKNGVYDISGISSRTLSEDDKAGMKSIYGKKSDDEICCGIIKGHIETLSNHKINEFQVWAEEADSGKVIAGVSTNASGDFSIEGLNPENYRIFAQPIIKNNLLSTVSLAEVSVNTDETVTINKQINFESKNFDVRYVGLNGQLSTITVPVHGGGSYLLYVGGKNFNAKDFDIDFNSPFFKVNKSSYSEHEFEKGITAISFEVSVDEKAEIGNYSIRLKNKNDQSAYLIGSISVSDSAKKTDN